MELPNDYGISSTFNVSDLVAYWDPAVIPSEPFEPSPPLVSDPVPESPLPAPFKQREQIEHILDEHVITTRSGAYQRYLVRWKGRPTTDNTWITRAELERLDPDLLERYQSDQDPYSTGPSSSHPRRIGGGTRRSARHAVRTTQASIWLGDDLAT